MPEFVNPFHFVPPTPPVEPASMASVAQTLAGKPDRGLPFQPIYPELLHDRYARSSGDRSLWSGRILCRVTTKSPCVFGNRHRQVPFGNMADDLTTVVDNFTLDGRAAIASTELRGMLSSLIEMASGSAMRVLNNRTFSIRNSMGQSRSALGMVMGKKGQRKILPLTFPTFAAKKQRPEYRPTDPTQTNALWDTIRNRRLAANLPADFSPIYVSKASRLNGELAFSKEFKVAALPAGHYDQIVWKNGKPDNFQVEGRIKKTTQNREGESYLLRPLKLQPLPNTERPNGTAEQVLGIIRLLDDEWRDSNLKKSSFATFIRIPPAWNKDGTFAFEKVPAELLLNAEDACKTFDAIATDEFSNAPADVSCTSLKNQEPFARPKKKGDKLKNAGLQQGDLVYFRPRQLSQEIDVESVSISGIWRDGIRRLWNMDGSADLLDSAERRPMDALRTQVSLAEKMFGWVGNTEQIIDADAAHERGEVTGYKGRVRISDAISIESLEQCLMPAHRLTGPLANVRIPGTQGLYPLKILATPKPPCPELYMRTTSVNPRNIRKDFIRDPNTRIHGWKFYWADKRTIEADGVAIWTTHKNDNWKQKCWVRPLKRGTEFWFHVDFESLTDTELELLCYALRPGDGFVHRCGFAKPLGLGAVEITPLVCGWIDRTHRYASHLDLLDRAPRFSAKGDPDNRVAAAGKFRDAQSRLLCETPDAGVDSRYYRGTKGDYPLCETLAANYATRIGSLHEQILLSGRPIDGIELTYPILPTQDNETDLYQWFTANRDNSGTLKQQPLQPLPTDGSVAPRLE